MRFNFGRKQSNRKSSGKQQALNGKNGSRLTAAGVGATLFLVLLAACLFSVPSAESKRTSTGADPFAPVAAGTLNIKMTGQFFPTPTDTFTLRKQFFTGSTNCSSGGGPITYVTNVNSSSGDSNLITAADSMLVVGFPGSNRNGQFTGFQNPDGATLDFLPGNVVCVHGFDNTTKNVLAQYSPGVQTLDATCTNPKFYYNPGDTLCVRVAGTGGTGGTPWKVGAGGGSVNECDSYPGIGFVNITSETQTVTYTLPANNSAIPNPACTVNNTVDIRGNWRTFLLDQGNNNRGSDNFRLRSNSPAAELSVNKSVNDPGGDSSFPPAGKAVYQIGVQNNGPDIAPNPVLIENVPAGTTFSSFTQTGGLPFNCTGTGPVTCTRSSFSPDTFASFKMVVNYSGLSNGTVVTNTSTWNSAATDFSSPNNTAQAMANITTNPLVCQFTCHPDIMVASTNSNGAMVNYSPAFTTGPSPCTTTSQCSPANNTVFPIGTTVVGCVAINGAGSCNFKVIVTDGQRSDLEIQKGHFGFWPRGSTGQTYSILVRNTGALATSGTVTVVDSLPPGLTPTAISGTGWTCNLGTLTCTRNDVLPSGASYPLIHVTVNVDYYLFGPVNNNATVSGGNEGVTTNDTAMDRTIIIAPLAPSAPTATNADVSGRIVDTAGNAVSGATVRLTGTQNRLTITDANGNYRFDNVETNGFYTVTPSRPNYTFSPTQRSFSQLGQHTDAAFTAAPNNVSLINPLDTTEFFVRQQYLDFLNREPEEGGLTAWVNGLSNCASGDTSCDRLHVAEMFFRSSEFQERGYYLYRFYSAAFGRKPDYAEFTADMGRVSGFLTLDQLDTAKARFASDFTQRPAFLAAYGSLNNADYVDALINTAQVSLSNRQTIIDALNNGAIDRSHALRLVVESAEVYQKNYNQAFVVMEYFGYLHRDPDALYLNWIDVLNQTGDPRHMIEGFVNSGEYRNRFQR